MEQSTTETADTSRDVVTGSIRLLAEQGWEATTVDRLAEAAGISRATFFRKYGSKEDIVFADHAANLERLERLLARPDAGADPAAALREGVLLVFRHHLEHRGRTFARHALLRQVPQLRDRELITSHRYEQVFRRYLQAVLPGSPQRDTVATALSAATVAVHNAHLRAWLRAPRTDPSAELAAQTERLAHVLVAGFDDATSPGSDAAAAGTVAAGAAAAPRPAVVVTVLDAEAGTDEIVESVRAALSAGPGAQTSSARTA